MACSAFVIRVTNTCCSSRGSASISANPAAAFSSMLTFFCRNSGACCSTTFRIISSGWIFWLASAEGLEKASRCWTIPAARRACFKTMSACRRVTSSVARSRIKSLTPRIAVSGLFSSCATPDIISPIAASFSFCSFCFSASFASVTSRAEATTPLMRPPEP